MSVDEYYGWMFEHSVPGLPEAAATEDLTPLQYMRKYGAFEIDRDLYSLQDAAGVGPEVAGEQRRCGGVASHGAVAAGGGHGQ